MLRNAIHFGAVLCFLLGRSSVFSCTRLSRAQRCLDVYSGLLHIVRLGWIRRGLRGIYFNAHKYQQPHPNPNVNKHKPAFAQASNLHSKPSLLALEKLLHDYLAWQRKFMLVQMASLVLTDAPKLERQVSELATY
ncbi:hypothetical protein EDB19DRAFT_1836562 [Suillus lakei]|nr:hypothetical protein EDB19DRAFT_1836562 [Suillus lakei]